MRIRELLLSCLARQPRLYKQLLFIKGKGNYNLDKIAFLSLVREGDTVFDVGANVGYYTLLFSQIVGRQGEVHAFEPVPDTFAKLASLIRTNDRGKNVYLNQVAIGEACSDKEIFIPGDDFGQASLAQHQSNSRSQVTTASHVIPVITIDSYVNEKQLNCLDFIKIDVEGYELMCLQGAKNTLARFTPLLYLEIYHDWSKKFHYAPPDIVAFLQGLGYTDFYLVHDGIRRLGNAGFDLDPQRFSYPGNLICAVASKHSRQLKELPEI